MEGLAGVGEACAHRELQHLLPGALGQAVHQVLHDSACFLHVRVWLEGFHHALVAGQCAHQEVMENLVE